MSRWALPARDNSATSGVVTGAAGAPAGRLGDVEGGGGHDGKVILTTRADGLGGGDCLSMEFFDFAAHAGTVAFDHEARAARDTSATGSRFRGVLDAEEVHEDALQNALVRLIAGLQIFQRNALIGHKVAGVDEL